MERILLTSIIGIAAAMAVQSVHAQGQVLLDNYYGSGNPILYGAGVPGGTVGAGIVNSGGITWTIGIYGAVGNITVASDSSGTADPLTLGSFTLLPNTTGILSLVNATTGILTPLPGYFSDPFVVNLPGYASGAATFMVVAYSGSTYDGSAYRGHSLAITDITPATPDAATPYISSFEGGMQSFDVLTAPEPSVFALSGIGAAALMVMRRKKLH